MIRLMIIALSVLGASARSSADDTATTTVTPSPTRASATSSTGPATHTVAVGASGHRFTESEVFADVGDIVEFIFYPANHSVVRAEYLFPCFPYEIHGVGRQGFNSGFQPVRAITHDSPRWRITINNTDPIFYYCGADGSCYKNHMIGVINPNETQTLENHIQAAEGLTFQILPGQPFPEEQGHGHPSPSTPTPSPGEEQNPNGPPPAEIGSAQGGDSLDAGQIAGIAIGSTALFIIIASVIYLCGRRGGMEKMHRRFTFTGQQPMAMSEANYTTSTKSPGIDSRWSAARWSMKAPLSPYQEQPNPQRMMPMAASPVHMGAPPYLAYGFPGMEAQNTGHSQHSGSLYDPRMGHTNSPPPKAIPWPSPQTPIELPSESGQSPAQARYSWVGQDSEATFRASR